MNRSAGRDLRRRYSPGRAVVASPARRYSPAPGGVGADSQKLCKPFAVPLLGDGAPTFSELVRMHLLPGYREN